MSSVKCQMSILFYFLSLEHKILNIKLNIKKYIYIVFVQNAYFENKY